MRKYKVVKKSGRYSIYESKRYFYSIWGNFHPVKGYSGYSSQVMANEVCESLAMSDSREHSGSAYAIDSKGRDSLWVNGKRIHRASKHVKVIPEKHQNKQDYE